MYISALQSVAANAINKNDNQVGGGQDKNILVNLVVVLVVVSLIFLLGQWLWNEYLVKLFPFVKKADSVTDLLALSVLISILTGR